MGSSTAKVVAVCGIDGSGKTTILAALEAAHYISSARFCAFQHRTNVARVHKLRPSISARPFLGTTDHRALCWAYCCDFLSYYIDDIESVLPEQGVIISDRWTYCVSAFCPADNTRTDITDILSSIKIPDLVIYIDVEPHVAYERIRMRGDQQPSKTLEILTFYRSGYETVLRSIGARVLKICNVNFDAAVDCARDAIVRLISS